MKDSEPILIGLGANRGDRLAGLAAAVNRLGRRGVRIRRVSPVYLTSPVGVRGQPWFMNAVVSARTRRSPRALLRTMLAVERKLGRRLRKGPRTIDLDLLLHGRRVLAEPDLTVPHARFHERLFALRPAARIAPRLVHPVFGKTVRVLAGSLKTRDVVRPLNSAGQRLFRSLASSPRRGSAPGGKET